MVSRRQLAALGASASAIDRLVASGQLARLHRGVYAIGHRRLTDDGFRLAAVMAAGRGAVLSHRDAAALHALLPSRRARIDVTTRAQRGSTAAIRIHGRRLLAADEATRVRGIPVTTVARTLVDLAEVVQAPELRRALAEADRRRVLDVAAVERSLARARGRHGPGHARLRAALDRHAAVGAQRTRSPLEDAFLALLEQQGLAQPRTNVEVAGHEVDAHWPAQRLVVELDGWESHGTRAAFERDRAKDARLVAAGLRVLRFTHRQVSREPAVVANRLRTAGVPPTIASPS